MRSALDQRLNRRRVWSSAGFRFAYGWVTSVVALLVAAAVFSGIDYGSFWTLVVAGLVFSLVNTVVRPLVILAIDAVLKPGRRRVGWFRQGPGRI